MKPLVYILALIGLWQVGDWLLGLSGFGPLIGLAFVALVGWSCLTYGDPLDGGTEQEKHDFLP
jgi:hypothetical protein